MIFPVNLKVLSQMLDPAGEKCDLHIRAAGIFVMQPELLEIRRLVALSHNEVAILDRRIDFGNRTTRVRVIFLSWMSLSFAIVPQRRAWHANAHRAARGLARQRIHAEILYADTCVIFGLK